MPRPVTSSPATSYYTSCAGTMSAKTGLHLLYDKSLIVVGNRIDRMTNFTGLATFHTISLLQVADQSGTGLTVIHITVKTHDRTKTTLGFTTDMVAGNRRLSMTGA